MNRTISPTEQADAFARALAGKPVDVNEVAKSFGHLRALLSRERDEAGRQRAVEQWWRWLETVTGSGARYVVRSSQTQRYYENIRDAAISYLQGLSAEELQHALGWGVRLLRYYKEVEGATQRPSPLSAPVPIGPGDSVRGDTPPVSEQPPPAKPAPARPAPAAPTLPSIDEPFRGVLEDADDQWVVVQIPGFDMKEVLGAVPTAQVGQYKPGDQRWVAVTKETRTTDERKLLILRLVPKAERRERGLK